MDLNSNLDLSSKSKSIIFLVVPIRFLSQKKKWNWNAKIEKADPFSEVSADDDEGDVDGVAAHEHLVKPFEDASSGGASSSSWIHGDFGFAGSLFCSRFWIFDLVR